MGLAKSSLTDLAARMRGVRDHEQYENFMAAARRLKTGRVIVD